MKKGILGFCLGLSLCCFSATATDWPHFRGAARDGRVPDSELKKPSFGFKLDWKRSLGSGYSTISVAGKTGVVLFSDGTSDLLTAFDTNTGTTKWTYTMGPVYKGHSGSQDGPTGSPTIDGDLVFALDPHGELVAVTLAEGKKVWGHKLGGDVPARLPYYGFSTIPTVVGSTVVVMTGAAEGHTFTGFDRASGKVLWSSNSDQSTYQSPSVWERNGQKRILAATDTHLVELDPQSGKEIWRHPHNHPDEEGYAMPLPMGPNQVLLMNTLGVVAFELKGEGDQVTMSELWRSNVFQRTYAIPVYRDGYLYGFKGQFLHCIEANTGNVKWRSRPPGGECLMLLGKSLVIVGADGALVAIDAVPTGYRETARLPLFEASSYSAASYADGMLYLRDLKEIARVSLTDAQAAVAPTVTRPELKGAFGAFVAELEKTTDKKAKIDAFLAATPSFPIIEAGGLVHYVFRGPAEDLAVARANQDEKPMYKVPDTDLWFYTETLEEDSHWTYAFSDVGESLVDPRNPLVLDKSNELRMPKWTYPSLLNEPVTHRGTVTEHTFKGRTGIERAMKVYLPHGYDGGKDRYPVILMPGLGGVNRGEVDKVLDSLIGKKMAAVVAVFVDVPRSEMAKLGPVADEIALDILPFIDKTYRTQADPAHRVLMGSGRESTVAAFTFSQHPDLFSKLGVQSFMYFPEVRPTITPLLDKPLSGKSAFIIHSRNDISFPDFDARLDCKTLAEQLKRAGWKLEEQTTAGASSWANWRVQLVTLFSWAAPK